jgi:hypothetical protein
LNRTVKAPAPLPRPETLVDRARDLEKALAADPVRAREALRGVFDKGRIEMHPGEDGTYLAKATFLPLVAVAAQNPTGRADDARVAVPFEVIVPKPPDRRWKKW